MTRKSALRDMDRAAFLATFSGVAEHSPWVAEAAWEEGPFEGLDSLHAAMRAAILGAGRERQLALLLAHPELAGAAAAQGWVTGDSRGEQSGAGLDILPAAQLARFRELNRAYREKFGFPFIVAVKGLTRDEILQRFAERLGNPPEAEFERGLAEVIEIVRLRLARLVRVD